MATNEQAVDTARARRRLEAVAEHVRRENAHDLDALMATFGASGFYDDAPWNEHHDGLAAVRAYYEALFRAAPDLHIDVVATHAAGEAVVLEVRLRGTHLGTWRGLPATGRRLDVPICGIFTFDEQDRLAGERIYYDRATVLTQLGVFFEPDTFRGKVVTTLTHPITMLGAARRAFPWTPRASARATTGPPDRS
jgi:steroid delta-isomerase-like uncharacterized protein